MNRWQGKWRNSWDSWHVHPQKDKEGVANKKQGESDHWPRILSPYLRLYHPVSARIVSMAPFFFIASISKKKKKEWFRLLPYMFAESIHDIHISGLSIASISYEQKKRIQDPDTIFQSLFQSFFILSLLFLHLLQQSIPLPFFWTFRVWVWDDLVSFVPSSISFRTLVILVIFKDF